MLFTGMHDDYHRPTDDPEKLNQEGIQKIADTLADIAVKIADHNGPLSFREASRYELTRTVPATPFPGRFGISWSPDRVSGQPIRITQVEESSPAAKAGLKIGDELVRVNGTPVIEIEDFIAWIRKSPRHLEIDLIRGETRTQEQIALDLQGFPLPVGLTAAADGAEPGVAVAVHVAPEGMAGQQGFRAGDSAGTRYWRDNYAATSSGFTLKALRDGHLGDDRSRD